MIDKNKKDLTPSERMAICRSCIYFERKFARCSQCNCWMNVKTQKPDESCPLEKWQDLKMDNEKKRITDPAERMKICKQCEYLTSQFARCKICGCFMAIKTKIPMTKCPDGRW